MLTRTLAYDQQWLGPSEWTESVKRRFISLERRGLTDNINGKEYLI